MAPKFSDSPNARSKSISTAEHETNGVLNRHSVNHPTLQVGISEDKGTRRTMEDAHSFVVDFDSIRGQGFFAVFDGHAGKHAAEWCGNHFHEQFLQVLHSSPAASIPDALNKTFHTVDGELSKHSAQSEGKIHSGCTAVTAFLRIEDAEGKQSFVPPTESSGSASPTGSDGDDPMLGSPKPDSVSFDRVDSLDDTASSKTKKSKLSGSRIRKAFKNLGKSTPRSSSPEEEDLSSSTGTVVIIPPEAHRRVLYSANAGDARGVLSRGGKAVRLTYDHKGSDRQEAKRITDAGGFVLSGRVNGVLAVTRSLGDTSMKEFVVGSPYTTETELCDEDEYLILACDGLWDVAGDQDAVDLIRDVDDAQQAADKLLKHALSNHTTDNVTVLVVRFKQAVRRPADDTVTAPPAADFAA
ncbi:phosphatase 2C-domain-containing protein [Coprinopsis sp. MPI-PUGE-AT-0042]|nr:phosphatase 2C-domain-containing protein [Coprinopsis sp. MPI-PUGE-AT-0042]